MIDNTLPNRYSKIKICSYLFCEFDHSEHVFDSEPDRQIKFCEYFYPDWR